MPENEDRARSLPSRIARPRGWAGVVATIACVLATLLALNSIALHYLEEQPESSSGPEAGDQVLRTLPGWHGLIELQAPVDTIILGDSAAYMDLAPGAIADRLGGTAMNLGNVSDSTALMDAWMLQYYLDKFGPPRNVILLRSCHSYEREHSVDFMSAVPLEWGWWDRLGPAPVWKDGEQWGLLASKYGVLYSDSEILSYRLMHPLDLFAQPHRKSGPARWYSHREYNPPSDLARFRRGASDTLYSPFCPSTDSANAMQAMSGQARSRGFQLYIVVGPQWDEAYQDTDAQAKVKVMKEWLAQFTDPQYVHLVLGTPMVFPAEQMQNPNHLYRSGQLLYTEAALAEIVAIQNRLAVVEGGSVQMSWASLVKGVSAAGDEPAVALSLTLNDCTDPSAAIAGTVSGLVRPSGKSDGEWTARAPATPFTVSCGESTDTWVTFSLGRVHEDGLYDVVLFIRRDAATFSFETRVDLPGVLAVGS